MIDVESSGPASADPIELEDPLPPKWSENRADYDLKPSFELHEVGSQYDDVMPIRTIDDTDQAVQRAVQAECDHRVPTTSILGGEPLTVTRCMACGLIDWADLRKQADAYARRYGARLLEETYGHLEYPDGSRRIAYSEMVNIQQVHSLFTIEPGTNMCEAIPETHTEDTLFKVRRALLGSGLSEQTVTVAINEMQNEGILFRERPA